MNVLSINTLKVLRKLYINSFGGNNRTKPKCVNDPDVASDIIYKALTDDKPRMIARFGSVELVCLLNYVGVKSPKSNLIDFIKGKSQPWWWDDSVLSPMHNNAGFFPTSIDKVEQFCELMFQDIQEVDILGSWLPNEMYFENEIQDRTKINLELLNPYFSKIPWTNALENKKVLVVHPFAKTIEQQYKKRELIFPNNLLPKFELRTVRAVQSIGGEKTEFNDWFEALDSMKADIDKEDYDICLIGCGAYGFPLAAHVKRMGKKSFHIGGSLQLLFGIRGKRWENENYNDVYNYSKLMNEHWVKPDEDEKPQNASKVEGACYW